MQQMQHADECPYRMDPEGWLLQEEAPHSPLSFHFTVKPVGKAMVEVYIYESCVECARTVAYMGTRLPRWRFEQRWTYKLRTWYATWCSRAGLWDSEEAPF